MATIHSEDGIVSEDERSVALRTADGRGHFIALDSLRGICACMVVLFHFETDAVLGNLPLVRNAFLFVDFFFVLSGFVMAESYEAKLGGRLSIGRFMALRAGRLFPMHAAVLAALLLLQAGAMIAPSLAQKGEHGVTSFFATLFLVQIWVPSDLAGAWNMPSWSIAAEMWTYLAFACIVRLAGRYRMAIFTVAIIAAPFLIDRTSDRHINVCYAGAALRCIYSFFLGILCNHLLHRRETDRHSDIFWSIAQIVTVLAAMILVWFAGATIWSYLAPWLFAAAIFSLAREAGIVSRALRHKLFVKLGIWSYSIYLVHIFVQARFSNLLTLLHWRVANSLHDPVPSLISRHAPFPYASDAITIVMLAVTIAVSALTFRYIEEPGRIWSRALFGGGRKPAELDRRSTPN